MKKLFIFLAIFLIGDPVVAQTPIDPLRLPQEEVGSYIYTFGVTYIPDGRQGFNVDGNGNGFNFDNFSQSMNFFISGSYSFSQYFSISANVNPSLLTITENRDFEKDSDTITKTDTDINAGLSVEYRPKPNSTLDPRFSVGINYPWNLTVQGQASLIRDPIILLTSLGYSQSLESENSSLNLGVGAGFIANDRISFSSSANYSIPVGETSLPISSVSFRTSYNLDDKGDQDIGLRTTLSNQGGDTTLGLSIEWGGRGVITRRRQEIAPITNNAKSNSSNTSILNNNNVSPTVNSLPTNSTSNTPLVSVPNITPNTNALTENTADAIKQLYQRLQEKDGQIEVLEQQIIQLKMSLEVLRCQIPENRQTCQKK